MGEDDMKVIFNPPPKEKFWHWLWRSLRRKPHPDAALRVVMNGRALVIKRGVVVDVPEWGPEVAAHTARYSDSYDCYVLYDLLSGIDC